MAEKPTVVELAPWANPEAVNNCVLRFQTYCKERKVKAVTILGENADGSLYIAASNTDDRFKTAANLICHAIELLGFVPKNS